MILPPTRQTRGPLSILPTVTQSLLPRDVVGGFLFVNLNYTLVFDGDYLSIQTSHKQKSPYDKDGWRSLWNTDTQFIDSPDPSGPLIKTNIAVHPILPTILELCISLRVPSDWGGRGKIYPPTGKKTLSSEWWRESWTGSQSIRNNLSRRNLKGSEKEEYWIVVVSVLPLIDYEWLTNDPRSVTRDQFNVTIVHNRGKTSHPFSSGLPHFLYDF